MIKNRVKLFQRALKSMFPIGFVLWISLVVLFTHANAQSLKTFAKASSQSIFDTRPIVSSSVSTIQIKSVSSQPKTGYLPVGFDLLGGYPYRERIAVNGIAMTNKANQIPQNVKELNGKKVSIQGYFYPLELGEGGTIQSFLLLRNQIYCCFGDAVRSNEWISVSMSNRKPFKAEYTSHIVTLYGKLEVGEIYDKEDTLISIYRMKADKIVPVSI